MRAGGSLSESPPFLLLLWELERKTRGFFRAKKLHKWPGKLLLCVCHWWIPSRLSPGGLEGYFPVVVRLQKKSLVKCPATFVLLQSRVSWVSCRLEVSGDYHGPLVWWSASQRCSLTPPSPGFSVSFAASEPFLSPVKQHLLVTSLLPGCKPRGCFRNASILALPHLALQLKLSPKPIPLTACTQI